MSYPFAGWLGILTYRHWRPGTKNLVKMCTDRPSTLGRLCPMRSSIMGFHCRGVFKHLANEQNCLPCGYHSTSFLAVPGHEPENKVAMIVRLRTKCRANKHNFPITRLNCLLLLVNYIRSTNKRLWGQLSPFQRGQIEGTGHGGGIHLPWKRICHPQLQCCWQPLHPLPHRRSYAPCQYSTVSCCWRKPLTTQEVKQ